MLKCILKIVKINTKIRNKIRFFLLCPEFKPVKEAMGCSPYEALSGWGSGKVFPIPQGGYL